MKELRSVHVLPEVVIEALHRKKIELSDISIGKHFRSIVEIEDIKSNLQKALQKFRATEANILSIGLGGSRTRGSFYYDPEKLAARLYFTHGLSTEFGISDEDLTRLAMRGTLLPQISLMVVELADWLEARGREVENFHEIDLTSAPDHFQKFLRFKRETNKQWLFPSNNHSGDDRNSYNRKYPYPAAFYPDVDLFVFRWGRQGDDLYNQKAHSCVGEKSGTAIQIHQIPVYEGISKMYLENIEKLQAEFLPFRLRE